MEKNIHILPTEGESNLFYADKGKELCYTRRSTFYVTGQHIYITSDEDIKVGDWCHTIGTSLFNTQIGRVTEQVISDNGKYGIVFKKIILTTDKKLIADGVQAIDDEFLEWYVKNSSCEFVRIESWETKGEWDLYYKITIPQEEPKQETLEEAAERHYINCIPSDRHSFINGALWQADRMYTEEDMKTLIDIINWYDENSDVCPNFEIPEIKKGVALIDWFVDFEEQFKKK